MMNACTGTSSTLVRCRKGTPCRSHVSFLTYSSASVGSAVPTLRYAMVRERSLNRDLSSVLSGCGLVDRGPWWFVVVARIAAVVAVDGEVRQPKPSHGVDLVQSAEPEPSMLEAVANVAVGKVV